MRTKHLILILIGVIIATIVFIAFGPAGEPNDSFKNIVVQTHQQFKEFQRGARALSMRLHSDYSYSIFTCVRSKQAH
uniref:MIP02889p n=1 Tax=Drosophila melanogaster TaxID=7227 RepID=D3DMJ5_DROME|nr:MIP02889p [Drosophila melanogaster]